MWRRSAARAALAAAAIAVALLGVLGSASGAGAQASVTAVHEVSCLADNGRVDTWVTNGGGTSIVVQVTLTGLAPRERTVAADTTERITITGRRDGDYQLQVVAGGQTILDQSLTVACDPPAPEVSVSATCLSGNGRVDVALTNATASTAIYSATIGALAPRSTTVGAQASGRITVTGRRDGPLVVRVSRNGTEIAAQTVQISCDVLLPDGSDAVVSQSCLAGNGVFRVDVANRSAAPATFELTLSGLAPRQRTIDTGRIGRFTVTGRPDGVYDVVVRQANTLVFEQRDLVVACDPVRRLVPEIVRTFGHDRRAFTQGLVIDDGRLFESTGAPAGFTSTVRELDPETGDVLRTRDFGTGFFGEGLAAVGDRLYFLSWRQEIVRVLERDDPTPEGATPFASVGSFTYSGQGWGLCFDGTDLVMSNGTSGLTFRDPVTFAIRRQVSVTLDGAPLSRLNELECVDGGVWANVWLTDTIVEIEPLTGQVRSVVDASMLEQPRPSSGNAVLNGIAWDPDARTWLLTGKEWPTFYEVRLVSAP